MILLADYIFRTRHIWRVFAFNFYPFHGILVVGKVIEAQRNTSSSH